MTLYDENSYFVNKKTNTCLLFLNMDVKKVLYHNSIINKIMEEFR